MEGCYIERGALIGMNATILDGVRVGPGAAIAAGSVVREGLAIPAAVLAAGVPAAIKGALHEELRGRLASAAQDYRRYSEIYQRTAVISDFGDR